MFAACSRFVNLETINLFHTAQTSIYANILYLLMRSYVRMWQGKRYFVSGEFHQTLLKRISFEVAQKV